MKKPSLRWKAMANPQTEIFVTENTNCPEGATTAKSCCRCRVVTDQATQKGVVQRNRLNTSATLPTLANTAPLTSPTSQTMWRICVLMSARIRKTTGFSIPRNTRAIGIRRGKRRGIVKIPKNFTWKIQKAKRQALISAVKALSFQMMELTRSKKDRLLQAFPTRLSAKTGPWLSLSANSAMRWKAASTV